MTSAELAQCRKRLVQFLLDLVAPLGRRERRHWATVYVRGLLDGERKSMEPLATRVPDGNVQAQQQLVGQSPWDWQPVWEQLARRMTAELAPEPAWVVDDTGFPKQGAHSVGVERQASGTLGKVGNCQVAVSLHQVGDLGHAILGWRLYLPERWVTDPARRQAAGIPDAVSFQPKWHLGLDLIDQARAWGLPERLVVADAGYGDVTAFRDGLEARRLVYVVGVSAAVGVWTELPEAAIPHYRGRGTIPENRPGCHSSFGRGFSIIQVRGSANTQAAAGADVFAAASAFPPALDAHVEFLAEPGGALVPGPDHRTSAPWLLRQRGGDHRGDPSVSRHSKPESAGFRVECARGADSREDRQM